MPAESFVRKARRVVIACRVMEPELTSVLSEGEAGDDVPEIIYLDQVLHRTPGKLLALVQEKIDEAAQTASRIVLGYGLCSNGVVGVTARQQGLIIPRCHDCIALFLGSPARYHDIFHSKPGTYYLTPGWLAEKKDPLGIIEDDYVKRVGREMGEWAMREELKNYTRIALVDTGVGDIEPLRARAQENARFFSMRYEEIRAASLAFFARLMDGPYDEAEFLRLHPGEPVTQDMFMS